MNLVTALLAGVLFGTGLLVSGMVDPGVVLGFLDVAGAWNPALGFTMAGAILVAAPAYYWVRRHGRTLAGESVSLPDRTKIDGPLLAGAAIFGLGWGLSGICPAPGLLLASGLDPLALAFLAAMLAGMWLAWRWRRAT